MNLNPAEVDERSIDAADDDGGRIVGLTVGALHDVVEQSHRFHELVAEYDDQQPQLQLNEVQHHQHLAGADARAQCHFNWKCWRHSYSTATGRLHSIYCIVSWTGSTCV